MSSIGSFKICPAVIGLLATASNLQAALVAYEGFNYAANEGIASKTGGSGWGATWDAAGGGNIGNTTTQASGLSGTGVTSTGGSLTFGSPPAVTPGSTLTSQAQRQFSSTFGSNGSTVWVGMLWQNLTTVAEATAAGDTAFRETKLVFFSGASAAAGVSNRNGTELVGIGIPHTYSVGASDSYSLFRTTGSDQFFASSGVSTLRGAASSNTVFLLTKFTLNGLATAGGDSISMWVNPNLAAGEAGLGAAQITQAVAGIDLDGVNAFRFAAATDNASGANGQVQLDEIRVGTTFSDAFSGTLAVPEPGTAVLGLLGTVALLRRSRRH